MDQHGTLFQYLAAFITIVLALALTDLAVSFHKLLRARARVKWRVIPLLMAAYVLMYILSSFFGIWEISNLDPIKFHRLAAELVIPVLYFLASSAVLPDEVEASGLDLQDFYLGERRYFLPVLILANLMDAVGNILRIGPSLHDSAAWMGFTTQLALLYGATLVALAAMWATRIRWVHWVGMAVLFTAAFAGFSGRPVPLDPPQAASSAPAPAAPAPPPAK